MINHMDSGGKLSRIIQWGAGPRLWRSPAAALTNLTTPGGSASHFARTAAVAKPSRSTHESYRAGRFYVALCSDALRLGFATAAVRLTVQSRCASFEQSRQKPIVRNRKVTHVPRFMNGSNQLDNEIAELKSFIADLKSDRASQKEKERRESWTKYTSMSLVFIAVLAAGATQWAGKYSGRTLVELNNSTFYQAEASDQWSFYQSKSIKQNLYEALR